MGEEEVSGLAKVALDDALGLVMMLEDAALTRRRLCTSLVHLA